MSTWTPAKDISRYQGNWKDTGEPIVMIKAGGGDAGLYFDPNCTQDYDGAVKDGRAVGLYWFYGGTNPTAEASFFCRGLQPYAVGDVPAIDVESSANWNPIADKNAVSKVNQFIDYVESQGFTGGLVYMNLATLNAHDWTSVFKRWGLWLADWAVSPDATIPTKYVYVMQQYNDGPNYDHDAFFGSVEQFKKYGWHEVAKVTVPLETTTQASPEPSTQTSEPENITQSTSTASSENTTTLTTSTRSPGTVIDVVVSKPTPEPEPEPATSSINDALPIVRTPEPDTTPIISEDFTPVPTPKDHAVDVLIRTAKTYVASVLGIISAGGLDVIHVSASNNAKLSALAAMVTAIWNAGIKIYSSTKS